MIDQNSKFFAILTAIGEAKQANADALGIAWLITHMGVGDANDTDPLPDRLQTTLINERRRAPLNQLVTDPKNPGLLMAEQVIPADVGGWWVREVGLYDADGDLIAISNCAPSYKPLLSQGSGRTQVVRMTFIISSTANVLLKIDPSVVIATRDYVDRKVLEELDKLDFKHSVLVATVAPLTLIGLQNIDDVAVHEGARVLVKDQLLAKDNGPYVASAKEWKRTSDADISPEITPGLFVHVEKGTAHGNSIWQLVTDAPVALGTTDLVFEMAIGQTGVGAGTYRSVTVDKNGRVVSGTNPATLTAYGIEMATQAEAEAQTEQDNAKPMTVLRVFQAITKYVLKATETIAGITTIATQDQVNQGTDDTAFVTPKKMRLGFSFMLGGVGYICFPTWMGGLVFQWTAVGVTASLGPSNGLYYGEASTTFPMVFPNSCWLALATPFDTAGVEGGAAVKAPTRTGVHVVTHTSIPGSAFAYTFAIGN